jgi:hypothetical protein
MRLKEVRQGLNGLMLSYMRLEKPGRALLLCLLCVEAGWQILVIAWLRLERTYLKLRLYLQAAMHCWIMPIAAQRPIPSTASIF